MRTSRAIESEKHIEIVNAYQAGSSAKLISEKIGWTTSGVHKVLRNAKVQLRPKGLSKDDEAEVVRKYILGKTSVELGKEYNRSVDFICNTLQKHNIPRRQQPSYQFDRHFFDRVDTEEKAYILGFLYADGYNGEKNGKWRVRLDIHIKDEEILHKMKSCLNSNHPILYDRRNKCQLALCDKHFSLRLAELGCMKKKTFLLTFPEWLEPNLYCHFIRGYNDGDGYIYFNGEASVHTGAAGTVDFISQMLEIIKEQCGVTASYSNHLRSPGIVNSIVQGRDQVSRVLAWLYKDATIYLERKKRKAEQVLTPVYYKPRPCGIRCNLATLDEATVIQIKRHIGAGLTNHQIHKLLVVSKQQLFGIRHGKTWRHIVG